MIWLNVEFLNLSIWFEKLCKIEVTRVKSVSMTKNCHYATWCYFVSTIGNIHVKNPTLHSSERQMIIIYTGTIISVQFKEQT